MRNLATLLLVVAAASPSAVLGQQGTTQGAVNQAVIKAIGGQPDEGRKWAISANEKAIDLEQAVDAVGSEVGLTRATHRTEVFDCSSKPRDCTFGSFSGLVEIESVERNSNGVFVRLWTMTPYTTLRTARGEVEFKLFLATVVLKEGSWVVTELRLLLRS